MTTARILLKQRRRDEVWRKYCGHLDLRLEEFMNIQKELLHEQLRLLGQSRLGQHVLQGGVPTSVEEFRHTVPLTTYEDYIPYLPEKREEVLPRKPHFWARTSGRSGAYDIKWVPHSREMYTRMGESTITAIICSSCSKRGEVLLERDDKILLGLAPPPYILGFFARGMAEQLDIKTMPPIEQAEGMGFAERTQLGFKQAMEFGADYFNGLASVLVRIGEEFENGLSNGRRSPQMLLNPRVGFRLLRGMVTAKLEGRNLLPADLWDLKGIMTGGMDTGLYKDAIERYWGRPPLEIYGCTEGGVIAHQAWNYAGLTFPPDINFLEFIPYDEHEKSKQDATYEPKTRLLDEVQPGIYELVLTNFHGSALVRYRIGDLIEIVALRDDELEIELPQMRFYSRADDVIFLAGFTMLTERTLWQAIENAGIHYEEWTARKEQFDGHPRLHLYLEPKPGEQRSEATIRARVHEQLQHLDADYKNVEDMLGFNALRLTLLPPGTFQAYFEDRQRAGADLAHLKPPHMCASDDVIDRLLQFS